MSINTKPKIFIPLCFLLAACFIIITFCTKKEKYADISETNSDQTSTTYNNYIQQDISDNLSIDAGINFQNLSICNTYEVLGKNFDIQQLKPYFWNNTDDLTTNTNPNANVIWINDLSGAELTAETGSMTYTDNQDFYKLPDLIKSVYKEELLNINDEQILYLNKKKEISDATDLITKIYNPSIYEKISLIKGIKINKEQLLQLQDSGLSSELIGEEAYYLFFGVSFNGIPMVNSNEYAFGVSYEGAVVSYESIEAIIDENGIHFLHLEGVFDIKKENSINILSVQHAIQALKSKYDLLILPEKQTINSIYLEYVFVHDAESQDYTKGKLVPYWCFNNDSVQHADRFSTLTGKDFQYE